MSSARQRIRMVSGLEQIKELHDLYWDNNEVSDFRFKIFIIFNMRSEI